MMRIVINSSFLAETLSHFSWIQKFLLPFYTPYQRGKTKFFSNLGLAFWEAKSTMTPNKAVPIYLKSVAGQPISSIPYLELYSLDRFMYIERLEPEIRGICLRSEFVA